MAIEVVLADAPVAWELSGPAEIFDAAEDLAGRGFRGDVAFWHELVDGVPVGDLVWSIEVNPETGGGSVKAMVGDYLLLSGGVLQRLSADEFGQVTA